MLRPGFVASLAMLAAGIFLLVACEQGGREESAAPARTAAEDGPIAISDTSPSIPSAAPAPPVTIADADTPTPPGAHADPETRTLDLGGGVSLTLVYIPAGEFLMGSPSSEEGRSPDEGPQTRVRISKDFWMGKTEVTVGQWKQFTAETSYRTEAEKGDGAYVWTDSGKRMDERANWETPGFYQTESHPVTCVSWNDAQEFCGWLSRKAGVTVELPTEAQWEYACRAGTTTAYHWGSSPDDGELWANGADRSARQKYPGWRTGFDWYDGYVKTSRVKTYRPNAFGLHDMHGNVAEWCSDWYSDELAGSNVTDPTGPNSGTYRVYRNGGWDGDRRDLRSAYRFRAGPGARNDTLGFRVCLPN